MIPVGYMAKKVVKKPDWLQADMVTDIYSVSGCVSPDFADYINYWKHNGYWLFDSPEIIKQIASDNGIDLKGIKYFYYEAYELQCYEDDPEWEEYSPEKSFETNVIIPTQKTLEGFDIVSFSNGNDPECSYLSCNNMAKEIKVNEHCLLETFEEAEQLLNKTAFVGCEPGPCRIFAVYSIPNA